MGELWELHGKTLTTDFSPWQQDSVQPNLVSLSAAVGTVTWLGALDLMKSCQDRETREPLDVTDDGWAEGS